MNFTSTASLLAAFTAAFSLATCTEDGDPACSDEIQSELFRRRIAPILNDDRPKSCNQCHLSGIDLGLWLQDSPCKTMACMVDDGLVSLSAPEQSLVLTWIERATPASSGITADLIAEEREAVLQWIESTAQCGVCDPDPNPCGRISGVSSKKCKNVEVDPDIVAQNDSGDCEEKTLEALFSQSFFPFRARCQPCHFEDQPTLLPKATKWIAVGPCDVASLQTMRNVMAKGYINVDDPEQSRWILKPLDEDIGGIKHGGGAKFHAKSEATYRGMLYWAKRYAACQQKP